MDIRLRVASDGREGHAGSTSDGLRDAEAGASERGRAVPSSWGGSCEARQGGTSRGRETAASPLDGGAVEGGGVERTGGGGRAAAAAVARGGSRAGALRGGDEAFALGGGAAGFAEEEGEGRAEGGLEHRLLARVSV